MALMPVPTAEAIAKPANTVGDISNPRIHLVICTVGAEATHSPLSLKPQHLRPPMAGVKVLFDRRFNPDDARVLKEIRHPAVNPKHFRSADGASHE